MSEYNPDVWVIVEISGAEVSETYHRILAGWHGGFTTGNSWKISSGVVKILDSGELWEIHNHSGSIYQCHKNCERLSTMTANILSSYVNQNTDGIAIKVVDIATILDQYKGENNHE